MDCDGVVRRLAVGIIEAGHYGIAARGAGLSCHAVVLNGDRIAVEQPVDRSAEHRVGRSILADGAIGRDVERRLGASEDAVAITQQVIGRTQARRDDRIRANRGGLAR